MKQRKGNLPITTLNADFGWVMPLKSIVKESVLILFPAVAVALTVNFLSPRGIALVGEWDTNRGVITAKAKNDPVVRELEIRDVALAREIYDRHKAVFVDARSREAFDAGHIEGAVSLPVGNFDEEIGAFVPAHPFETYLVTYCSGRECDDSHELAVRLFSAGYDRVSVFIDGYPGWEAAGYPVSRTGA
jgi:rhodanese-related sulfurtransferase